MGPPALERMKDAHSVASQWLRDTYRVSCTRRSLTPVLVGLFTVAYFAATCYLASLKPFWYDEITTYNIARSPTAGDVWRAWLESPDGMPPVVHFAAHIINFALGFSHVTARLPDMLGFWVMCLCVFIFLRRRVCPMLALVGMLLPLTVPAAYSYAYEMRGYGMVAGFSAAAVVCWDLVYDTRWRRVGLLGMPIFLAAAIATHLYAVLLIVPLALGELARTIERRRVDWRVWMGLVAACVLLLPANPVISHIRGLPEMFRHSVVDRLQVLRQLMELWPRFLSISATYLGLLAIVCLGRGRVSRADDPPSLITREGQPLPADWVLVIGLIALPAIGWLFANLVTGFIEFRYVIATVIGFSVGVPLLCQVGVRRRPEIALLLAAWMAVTAAGSTFAAWYTLRTTTITTAHIAAGGGCFRLLNVWRKLPPDDLPIVVSHFYVFHQLHHYAPEALKRRLVFVVDREFGKLIRPMVPYYGKVLGEHVEGLEEFLQSHPSFYLYDCEAIGRLPLVTWLLDAGASLRDSGLVEPLDIRMRRDLYRVSMKDGSTGNEIRR